MTERQRTTTHEGGRHRWLHTLRTGGGVLLITLGSIALIVYVAVFWLERNILTSEKWVTTVGTLPSDPVVASALGEYLANQLFTAVPVEEEIRDALPPKANFLASPLTVQLKGWTAQAVRQLVASDRFTAIWSTANKAAMEQLVGAARGEKQPLGSRVEKFELNLADARGDLASKIGSTSAILPELNPAARETRLGIAADLKVRRERVWTVIRTADFLYAVLPLAATACILGALAFSRDRRKTVMIFAGIVIVAGLIELIALKVVSGQVTDQVAQQYQPAVSHLYTAVIQPLKTLIYWQIGLGVGAIVCCILLGPARWAVRLRQSVTFRGLRRLHLRTRWQAFRQEVYHWQAQMYVAVGVLLLIWFAFVADAYTPTALLNGVLLGFCFVAVVYIWGHPACRAIA